MTTNKIPTDEEIKTEWERYPDDPPNCECRPIGRRNCNACHLKLIEKARAAGREEQREKDAEIAESGVCGDSCGTAAANKIARAIRAQGEEGEKTS